MNDKLEKYIRTHRASMDDKDPPEALWDKIAGEINSTSKIRPVSQKLVYWRVAAAVFFFATSALLIDKFGIDDSTPVVAVVNPVLNEAEGYYLELISQKSAEIRAYGINDYTDPQFAQDMNQLDSVYQELKKDLSLGNEQFIVDAMIQNLQLRIEVLSNQLDLIQSIENVKREKNESVNI